MSRPQINYVSAHNHSEPPATTVYGYGDNVAGHSLDSGLGRPQPQLGLGYRRRPDTASAGESAGPTADNLQQLAEGRAVGLELSPALP